MPKRYQTVLVTGASSGMGRDFAMRLLKDGMTVYAAARNVDRMRDLEAAGARVIAMDISREGDVVAAVERILAEAGGVDVLINNAGYGQYGPVEETPIDVARRQFEVNLFGLARLTQLLIPAMRRKGRGLIVNISSMGGKMYTPLGAWYHATKHALEGWSDSLRLELRPHGIDVVIVEPGVIDTGFGAGMAEHYQGDRAGPYGTLIARLQAATEESYAAGRASAPSIITDLVVRAIRADRPRTRYSAGRFGPLMIRLRWLLPDRWFDRLILSQVR